MAANVLIVAGEALAADLHKALAGEDDLVVCAATPTRARALVQTGLFDVIVMDDDYPRLHGRPEALRIGAKTPPPAELARRIAALLDARGRSSGALAELSFHELQALSRNHFVRCYLVALMTVHLGCVSHAAQKAGVERETLHRLLHRHHIRAARFRPERQRGTTDAA